MKSGILKHILIALAAAVAIYVVGFSALERFRNRRGGWVVTFQSDANGTPSLVVQQPALRLANVRFTFPGGKIARTNFAQTVHFDRPITNAPFGRVIFIDTTFLPGTLTLGLFGHEIELLPRVLVVDRRELPWKSEWHLELPQGPPAAQDAPAGHRPPGTGSHPDGGR